MSAGPLYWMLYDWSEFTTPEFQTKFWPLARLCSLLATRISYLLCETPRAVEVVSQPRSGWLESIPSGSVTSSVVSEPTTGADESA